MTPPLTPPLTLPLRGRAESGRYRRIRRARDPQYGFQAAGPTSAERPGRHRPCAPGPNCRSTVLLLDLFGDKPLEFLLRRPIALLSESSNSPVDHAGHRPFMFQHTLEEGEWRSEIGRGGSMPWSSTRPPLRST